MLAPCTGGQHLPRAQDRREEVAYVVRHLGPGAARGSRGSPGRLTNLATIVTLETPEDRCACRAFGAHGSLPGSLTLGSLLVPSITTEPGAVGAPPRHWRQIVPRWRRHHR